MNGNSDAIIILCSHICVGEGIFPLEPSEWSVLAEQMKAGGISPSDFITMSNSDWKNIFNFTQDEIERFNRLIGRSTSLSFELSRYMNLGIQIVTRADSDYPALLKQKLGKGCPPLFYCTGDLSLVRRKMIGFVGARSVTDQDMIFTRRMVGLVTNNRYGVISGGAKGVDRCATETAVSRNGFAVEFLSDSLMKRVRDVDTVKAIQNNQLVLLSVAKPDAGFNVGIAMMRNKYIYISSNGTIVVHSDFEKGGTWAGAIENLNNRWTAEYCWNYEGYKGNIELIKKGAISINDEWNFTLSEVDRVADTFEPQQLSLFDHI